VQHTLDLLIDDAEGIWHLCNQGQVSWYELACRAARMAGRDPMAVQPVRSGALAWPARRPAYSALGSERGCLLPSLDDALAQYFVHRHASEAVSDTHDVRVDLVRKAVDAL
jgi:dTDP-4-dehydrorhamnose reductase